MRHSRAKQEIVISRKFAREVRRATRRERRRCFFTRPFGHKYRVMESEEGMGKSLVCPECGKVKA